MERVLIENYKNGKNLFLIQKQESKGFFNPSWVPQEGKTYIIDEICLIGEFISKWVSKNFNLKIQNNSTIKNKDLNNFICNGKINNQLTDIECFTI